MAKAGRRIFPGYREHEFRCRTSSKRSRATLPEIADTTFPESLGQFSCTTKCTSFAVNSTVCTHRAVKRPWMWTPVRARAPWRPTNSYKWRKNSADTVCVHCVCLATTLIKCTFSLVFLTGRMFSPPLIVHKVSIAAGQAASKAGGSRTVVRYFDVLMNSHC